MKTLTKMLLCLLALCLLVPAVASCGKKDSDKNSPDKQTTPIVDNGGADDPDAGIDMPEIIDMGGYTYKAYVRMFSGDTLEDQWTGGNGNNLYKCIDFWVDQANCQQDAVSYAVYSRNNRIENDYNCKIRQVASNGNQLEFLTTSYANLEKYDLAILSAKPAAQAATRNLLRNLMDMEHITLTHPSFDQNAINELSVEDNLYYITGDMNVSTLEVAGLSLVNMDFYENIKETIVALFGGDKTYENIYDVVNEKKWTMDTMMKIATKANIDRDDSDGDLSVIDKGDTIGYHQYLYSTIWYFYSGGGRISTKNSDGIPELTIRNQKNQDLAEYLFTHMNSVVSVPWIPRSYSAMLDQNFLTGQVLFMDCSLFEIRTEIYPRAEMEYGILPCPLYEEGEDYNSVVFFNNWAHLWTIPNMAENVEYAERMLQIMAVYSSLKNSTMHAYYDRTIYLNAAHDNGSRQVMDLIRRSMVYDIALMYEWGGLERMLEEISYASTNPYGSAVSGIENRIQPMIDETVEKLRNPAMAS